MDQGVDRIVLYRESPTWQGLAVTSRSSLAGCRLRFLGSFSMLAMAVYKVTTENQLRIIIIINVCGGVAELPDVLDRMVMTG